MNMISKPDLQAWAIHISPDEFLPCCEMREHTDNSRESSQMLRRTDSLTFGSGIRQTWAGTSGLSHVPGSNLSQPDWTYSAPAAGMRINHHGPSGTTNLFISRVERGTHYHLVLGARSHVEGSLSHDGHVKMVDYRHLEHYTLGSTTRSLENTWINTFSPSLPSS